MKITRGRIEGAKKVTIYGPEGIGKSTFASRFPDPLFIDTEGSTKELDVARTEKPSSWAMLLSQVDEVLRDPAICRTLVIDTIDWAEQMCIQSICDKHHKDGLESFGYGSGYVYVKEEFGRFLNKLSDVVEAGVNVIVTAHAQMRKFEQPDEMGAYDRWELKLGKKTSSQTAPLVKEWCDLLLFANYKTISVAVDKDGKKYKAQGGRRVMYTSHHACWDAKNRYGLPEELPFDYDEIAHIFRQTKASAIQDKNTVSRAGTVPAGKAATQENEPEKKTQASGIPADGVQMTLPINPPTNPPKKEVENPDGATEPDVRIPQKLRDLMIMNHVSEWDIQNVVSARGYFPFDMPVRDYPADFIDGVLVGAWSQVYKMIKEMWEKEEIPFN